MLFFRPSRALAATLQCIWRTPTLVVSSFAIGRKSWRPFADHVRGSVAVSSSFLTVKSALSFSDAALQTDLLIWGDLVKIQVEPGFGELKGQSR